jgi:DedD protein
MDKVLKRRLIGATILIALAVIFVPMLLVDPDGMPSDDGGPIDIPPMPESAREVRRIPLDPRAAREPEPAEQRRSMAEAPVEYDPPATGAVADAADDGQADREIENRGRDAIGDEIVLRPQAPAEPQGDAVDSAAAAAPIETGRSVDPAPGPASDPAPVESAPSAPAVATSVDPEVSMGDWVVQVASFGSAQSAAEVRDRLERLGHIVLRDDIVRGDTTLVRLRTGPYPSREAAEQARQQIASTVRGVEPIVVGLEGAAAAPDRAPGFAVQVGSFIGENNAATETDRLKALGFEAFRRTEAIGGRTVWKVLVGPMTERVAADALRTRLADQAGVDGLVVSYP